MLSAMQDDVEQKALHGFTTPAWLLILWKDGNRRHRAQSNVALICMHKEYC